ncbi:MAG TPA: hypothetical protein VIQ62_05565 [Burkholderiales bacterium]|jgi:hypothetical protein
MSQFGADLAACAYPVIHHHRLPEHRPATLAHDTWIVSFVLDPACTGMMSRIDRSGYDCADTSCDAASGNSTAMQAVRTSLLEVAVPTPRH